MTLNEFYNRISYTLECSHKVNPMRWSAMVKWHKNRCNEGLTPALYLGIMDENTEREFQDYMGEY